jgi:Ca2+/Na+ antiporter
MILPTVIVVTTTMLINILKVFEVVFVMTGGNFGTAVIANRMFQLIVTNVGKSSAIAVGLILLTIPVMVFSLRRFRAEEGPDEPAGQTEPVLQQAAPPSRGDHPVRYMDHPHPGLVRYFLNSKPGLTLQITNLIDPPGGNWNILTGAAFLSFIIPVVIFFAFQRYFARGLLAGSVKG